MATDESEFQRLMDLRIDAKTPEEVSKIDADIREKFERPMGIMITDMAGMTELTKKRGILEILGLVRRMQRLAEPVIRQHEGKLVKTLADDLFIVHPTAKGLFAIAQGLLESAKKHNATSKDQILIGVGLAFGPIIFLGGEIWGDAVNVASKLGEDTAAGGEILMDEAFHAALLREGVTPSCSLLPESHRKAKFPYYVVV